MPDGPKPAVQPVLYNVSQSATWRGVSRNTWLKECDELGLWPDPVTISGKRFWVVADLNAALEQMKSNAA